MNSNDFLNGRMAATFANSRASADADEAIGEWKSFSNKLQSKLQKAELDCATTEAARSGLARLLKHFRMELQRLEPNNPLLRNEVQDKIIEEGAADKFAVLGYDYDPARKVVRKQS